MTTPTLSAVALTSRIVEVASLIDAAGARAFALNVDDLTHRTHGLDSHRGVVTVHTDGPGFRALVDRMHLAVQPDGGLNLAASGLVGPLDVPVLVITGRDEVVA